MLRQGLVAPGRWRSKMGFWIGRRDSEDSRSGSGVIIDETLRELEDEFVDLFVRVHRNAIVAAQYITGLDRDIEGHYQVRLQGVDEGLDISRRHVAAVRKFIKSL